MNNKQADDYHDATKSLRTYSTDFECKLCHKKFSYSNKVYFKVEGSGKQQSCCKECKKTLDVQLQKIKD